MGTALLGEAKLGQGWDAGSVHVFYEYVLVQTLIHSRNDRCDGDGR